MSVLLTPPRSSPRDKENCAVASSAPRVVWSEENSIHLLSPNRTSPLAPRTLNVEPGKSILKKSSLPLLPFLTENEREVTPEPEDFKQDTKYLVSPISSIINPNASLADLIEAYNILAARLRTCFSIDAEPQSSWPLLHPLKDNADTFAACVTRDLGCALEDPLWEDENRPLLPSPKPSPQKKRGMTADQVRHARDLCTTCQSVLKLLGIVLSYSAVMELLTEDHMRDILTAVIAIPLNPQLPTINARKTYALSIWLIQTQRLPADVLFPAKDRIAYALRRAIEGELGKEGKKGSTSDGLKAIHDLSVYQPETFVPAFSHIFSSVLGNLTASSLNIRLQACHALGGIVLGFISLPRKYFHTRIALELASFLKTVPLRGSPSKSVAGSDSPGRNESPIVRTLRTTLQNAECTHIAQGPVWAICVLSSFIVLLGPMLKTDRTISRIISALLNLVMRVKKGPMRCLACLTWRCVSWAYLQPTLPSSPTADSDSEDDVPLSPETCKLQETMWKVTTAVVDMGAGTSTIAGLLGEEERTDEHFQKIAEVLRIMMDRTSGTYLEALMVTRQLVQSEDKEVEWDINCLLPHSLFAANPGLLTADPTSVQSLTAAVNPLFSQIPDVADLPSLTMDDLTRNGFLSELWELWKDCLKVFPRFVDKHQLAELVETWKALLTAQIKAGTDDEDILQSVAFRGIDALTEILVDDEAKWYGKQSSQQASGSTSSPSQTTKVNTPLKMKVVRELWNALRSVVDSEEALYHPGERLTGCLMTYEHSLAYATHQARAYWTTLCGHVLMGCEVAVLKAFWGEKISYDLPQWKWDWSSEVRSGVWHRFAELWKGRDEVDLESVVVLLAVPLAPRNTWNLDSADFEAWESLLTFGIDKALDLGADTISFVDTVARTIGDNFDPSLGSSCRIADLLMTQAESSMSDVRELPESFLDFVNDILHSSYPPHPKDVTSSLWMLRSLTKIVENCPRALLSGCLASVQDGMVPWIKEWHSALQQGDYSDVQSLWEMVILRLFELPSSERTLKTFAPLLEAILVARENKGVSLDAFDDFWTEKYMDKVSRDAWPAAIQRYYPAPPPAPTASAPSPPVLTMEGEVPASPSPEPEEDVPEVPVLVPFPSVLQFEAQLPASPAKTDSEHLPSPPSTPASEPVSLPPTPSRPRKLSAEFGFPYTIPQGTPPSPTPRRCFWTPRSLTSPASPSSPSRKRKRQEENKENEAPGSPSRVRGSPRAAGALLGKRKFVEEEEPQEEEDAIGLKASPWKRRRMSGLFRLPLGSQAPTMTEDKVKLPSTSMALIPFVPFTSPVVAETAPQAENENMARDVQQQEPLSLFGSPIKPDSDLQPMEKVEGNTGPAEKVIWIPRKPAQLPRTPSSSPRKRAKVTVEPPALHDVYPDLYIPSPTKSMARSMLKRQASVPTPKRQSRRQPKLSFKLREAGHSGYGTPRRGLISIAGQLNTPSRDLSSDDDPRFGEITPSHSASPAMRLHCEDDAPGSDDSAISPVREIVRRRMLQRTVSI